MFVFSFFRAPLHCFADWKNEKYQVIGYEAKYKLIKPIQTWIKSFKSPNADSMFEMSLQIEPREGSEWNAIKSLLNEKHNHLREIARLKRLLEVSFPFSSFSLSSF